MAIITIRDNNGQVQEQLIFDRWHNTKWTEEYIDRVNGISTELEKVTRVICEYQQFADDTQGKRYFLESSKITTEFVLEDEIQKLPPEKQLEALTIIQKNYEIDIFVLTEILGIDATLEVS